jgi:excinuclease UvrABC ATPase subunit
MNNKQCSCYYEDRRGFKYSSHCYNVDDGKCHRCGKSIEEPIEMPVGYDLMSGRKYIDGDEIKDNIELT